jgi:hypothetical protein
MSSNIKVAVRVRPLLSSEISNGHTMDKIELKGDKKEIV